MIERDGPVCVWCARRLWPRDLTVEHLLPRARGGRGLPENLAVACRACNRGRRTRPVAAYVRAQLADGRTPRTDLITTALQRLAGSASREHVAYARRQLDLLAAAGAVR